MNNLSVNFSHSCGIVKPMHAVNNGPVYKRAADQRITNMPDYKAAGIPYARTHDASFFATYGGEHCVDITAVFPDFSKDPYDPASYDFQLTDEYLQTIQEAGTKTFYRLGSKIEHWSKKYGTLPPADFKKWAVICEHIIKHCNYGWADGLNMNIEYWEIWNEPDLDPDDCDHKRCWGGTAKEFYELYAITASHLKNAFPELKIGGPACANFHPDWLKGFFDRLGNIVPLDFFSWHIYSSSPDKIAETSIAVRKILDDNGYAQAESILNEWNYVSGWYGDEFLNSIKTILGLKGSSFTAAVMCEAQYAPLDMLMYYDARPSAFNGLFEAYTYRRLKGYYPFVMFNTLYKLKNSVATSSDNDKLHICAAKNGSKGAIMLTYFDNNDSAAPAEVKIDISGFSAENGVHAQYFLLDADHDLSLVREEIFTSDSFSPVLKLNLHASVLIKLHAL